MRYLWEYLSQQDEVGGTYKNSTSSGVEAYGVSALLGAVLQQSQVELAFN